MASDPNLGELAVHSESLLLGGGAVAAAFTFFRWMLTLAGGRQDARIAKLEALLEGRDEVRDGINNKLMALAHALSEVMSVLERHDTTDPVLEIARSHALDRARKAIADVFPAEGNHP